jgi:Tfp pilus assembly protein PilO
MTSIEEIKKLLAENKTEEAKQKLGEYLREIKWSPEEQGQMYAELASLYLKITNNILSGYQGLLEDVVEELKNLKTKEKELEKELEPIS